MSCSPDVTRRRFISTSLAAGASLVSGIHSERAFSSEARFDQRIKVAVVGAGGRGADNLQDLRPTGVDIVALCDCDERRAAPSFKSYPDAKRYTDWRRLFDEPATFDAVLVATPDHNHAIVSVAAMKLGKHVYCEKPLAHSIWEARQMAEAAAKAGVATQMGTQGHAFEGTRRAVEVFRSGVLGEVRELHVWTDRPKGWWSQGVGRPQGSPPVPQGLDWDVWLGPAPRRPFHPDYVPFKWRGFWDFGTGALGDMGVHNLDTAFWGLELTAPTSVKIKERSPAYTDPSASESLPLWSVIEFEFPARGNLPSVKMTWYDGGKLPPRDLFQGEPIPARDGGSLAIGLKGSLLTRTWHGGESKSDMFVLLPRKQFAEFEPPQRTLPRVTSHHHEWVAACRGEGKPLSNFGYASVLTESLLIGNLALRTGRDLRWDSRAMQAVGCPEADSYIRPDFRKGWSI
jgi:predicted dehydrogenase